MNIVISRGLITSLFPGNVATIVGKVETGVLLPKVSLCDPYLARDKIVVLHTCEGCDREDGYSVFIVLPLLATDIQ